MKNEEKEPIKVPDEFTMDYSLSVEEVRKKLKDREKEVNKAMEKLEK